MTDYHRIDPTTLAVVSSLAHNKNDWGAPRLTRIFNFTSRQVTTIYERGVLQEYTIPKHTDYGSSSKGYSAAVTSSTAAWNASSTACGKAGTISFPLFFIGLRSVSDITYQDSARHPVPPDTPMPHL